MGTGGETRQGLWIQTRKVEYTAGRDPSVTKYSEVTLIVDWGPTGVSDPAQVVHDHGLMIGMNFRAGHVPKLAWVAEAPGHASPETLTYTALTEVNAITKLLKKVFSTDGKWQGYRIPKNTVILPGPKNLYFKTTIDKFKTNHKMDMHFVPVVVALGDLPDFETHYAVGIGTFTRGKGQQSLELDTQALTQI
jgi:hypothetical protein